MCQAINKFMGEWLIAAGGGSKEGREREELELANERSSQINPHFV